MPFPAPPSARMRPALRMSPVTVAVSSMSMPKPLPEDAVEIVPVCVLIMLPVNTPASMLIPSKAPVKVIRPLLLMLPVKVLNADRSIAFWPTAEIVPPALFVMLPTKSTRGSLILMPLPAVPAIVPSFVIPPVKTVSPVMRMPSAAPMMREPAPLLVIPPMKTDVLISTP